MMSQSGIRQAMGWHGQAQSSELDHVRIVDEKAGGVAVDQHGQARSLTMPPGAWPMLALILTLLLLAPGCKRQTVEALPDYARPLPPGAPALRKLSPEEWPDLSKARFDAAFREALVRSIQWFEKPSTVRAFPVENITHPHAKASVNAFARVLDQSSGVPTEVERRLRDAFDCYTSVGWNGQGVVFFTGYYSPTFRASPTRTAEFQYPLYRKPPDLVTDEATGEVRGRQVAGQLVDYPTRAQIDAYADRLGLVGREVAWLPSKLDAYIIHVNGSARLQMTTGRDMYVGFAGTNGREYTSIGQLLVKAGKIEKHKLSLPAIIEYFKSHPDELDLYLNQNDRYVFFQEYDAASWPAGSLGVKVTPMRTVATDKEIFPRGGVVFVTTDIPAGADRTRSFAQFMMDQDTGGAIRSPGRGDIYMGAGEEAAALAGRQAAEGRLYYFFLKPERLGEQFSAR